MKKFILIVFLLLIVFQIYSLKKDDLSFRLSLDTGYKPFFYEDSNNSFITALNSEIMSGIMIKNITLGFQIYENYLSYNSQNSDRKLTGAYNILNFYFILLYTPIKYFEIKFGIGGGWFKSAFDYNGLGIISKNEGGISFLLDGYFYTPFKYINFEQKNIITLFFNNSELTPFYTGLVRVNFKPFFQWINFYLEFGGQTFIYKSQLNDIKSGSFIWGIGLSFDLKIPTMFKKIKKIDKDVTADQNKNQDNTNDVTADTKKDESNKSNETKDSDKKEEKIEPKKDEKIVIIEEVKTEEVKKTEDEILKEKIIAKYYNSKIDETILEEIFFNDTNEISGKSSLLLLNAIVETLKQNKKIVIAIGGYSIYTGDPTTEIENAKIKAVKIREYLEKSGIPKERIKIMASGRVYQKNQPIKDRKIEIKIIQR
ncbi:MAG TPA: hypothetical protein PK771_06615 [Spirochaetota bacterium]|nr:hypothetical protein [Spirochaetota bacterium]